VSDIYITENDCSATDVPAADGLVYDTDRIMFLRSYLTQLRDFLNPLSASGQTLLQAFAGDDLMEVSQGRNALRTM
jgi:hypothetical protein